MIDEAMELLDEWCLKHPQYSCASVKIERQSRYIKFSLILEFPKTVDQGESAALKVETRTVRRDIYIGHAEQNKAYVKQCLCATAREVCEAADKEIGK